MKHTLESRLGLLFSVLLLVAVSSGGPAEAQATFNLKITQVPWYQSSQPGQVGFTYTVTRTAAVGSLALESHSNKTVVLTAILPIGTTFLQATTPPGVSCSSDCAGTVTCNLGPVDGSILDSPATVTILVNRNGVAGPLRSASGVMSIEPEATTADNSASAAWHWNPGFSINAKNSTERCGDTGRKIRICQTGGGSLPVPQGPADVTICGIPAAAIENASSTEVTVTLGSWTATTSVPTLTGDVVINGQLIASSAFTYAVRGDANGNGKRTGADSFYLNLAIFLGGPPPPTVCSGDSNGNGVVSAADAFHLNLAIFLGGPTPNESGEPVVCPSQRPATNAEKDSISLGSVSGERGGRVTVPVMISNLPGNLLDAEGPSPIAAFAFNVKYSPKVFTGASVELVGACAAVPILRDFFAQSEASFAYYAHFNESKARAALARLSSGTGLECARVTLDISPTAPTGPTILQLDPQRSMLASFDGSATEEVANDQLRLENGLVTIR